MPIPRNELSAAEAAKKIESRELTAERLAAACLERIAAREPAVHAWAFVDREQALARAGGSIGRRARAACTACPSG